VQSVVKNKLYVGNIPRDMTKEDLEALLKAEVAGGRACVCVCVCVRAQGVCVGSGGGGAVRALLLLQRGRHPHNPMEGAPFVGMYV
jgi:hypothetical protein